LSKEGIRFAIQHIKISPNLKNDYQAAGAYMATQVQDAYAGSQMKQSAIRNSVVSEANTQDNPGGNPRNRRTPWLSSPNYKYNGATAYSSVNGINTGEKAIWQSYRSDEFTGDVKNYVLNRRRWQEYHGPADFFCDNDSVVKNTSIPTSTLAKKHNSLNYHIIRESAAAGILRVAKIPTDYNTSDALTKVLPMYKRNNLLNPVLHYPSELNIIES
jgi:hypothetical protein